MQGLRKVSQAWAFGLLCYNCRIVALYNPKPCKESEISIKFRAKFRAEVPRLPCYKGAFMKALLA